MQAGPIAGPDQRLHLRLVKTVQAVFPHVVSYSSQVPTYAIPWGFIVGGAQPIETRPDPDTIDALLAKRTNGTLRMLDGIAMLGLLQQPKYLRELIAAETEIYTLAEPPKLFGKGIVAKS